MKKIIRVAIFVHLLGIGYCLSAQGQSLPPDLQPIAASDVPVSAHTWISIQNFPSWPELPMYWLDDPVDLPLYVSPSLGTNIIFVDDTGIDYSDGGIEPHGRGMHSNYSLSEDGFADSPGYWAYGTNDLWLELVAVTNSTADLLIHAPTQSVYDIFYVESLPATNGWYWLARALPGETNVVIPNLPTDSGFFILGTTNGTIDPVTGLTAACMGLVGAKALTNDFNTNGIPDIWEVNYFGGLRPGTNDYNGDGVINYHEYLNGTDPNSILFVLEPTNQYCSTHSTELPLWVTNGVPSSMAVLVDATNFSTAVWTNYNPTPIVDLPAGEGWHQIWVGLRGRSEISQQAWQSVRVKLDITPPILTITNPSSTTVDRPVIQIQGVCAEALATLSYDLTNAAGLATGLPALVLHQYYDTNTLELTTNYFQCFDVPLTNGANIVTFHATDLAGNTTNISVTYNLDYSNKTNPPLVALGWPQNGTRIAGSNFTWHGWINDPTVQVTAQIIGTNAVTNLVSGVVNRDGWFRIENLPLSGGTNALSLTVTDAAGNSAITNISVIKSELTLTMDEPDFWSAVGTISDTNYTVWVNGVQAEIYDDGDEIDWVAYPTMTVDDPRMQVRAIPTGGNGSGNTPNSSQGNPLDPQAVDLETDIPMDGIAIYTEACHFKIHYDMPPAPLPLLTWFDEAMDWEERSGGSGFYNGNDGISDVYAFAPGRYPNFGSGVSTSQYAGLGDGTAYPPTSDDYWNHCDDVYTTPDGRHVWRETSDGELAMLTGGAPNETGQGLFFLTARASSPLPGWPAPGRLIRPEKISIGSLGTLDTNGNLVVGLPLNSQVSVTPRVPSEKQSQYSVQASRYVLVSSCVSPTPANRDRTTIGVGEQVKISLVQQGSGLVLPYPYSALVNWSTTAGSVYPTIGNSNLFTAPSNAMNVTVTVRYNSWTTNINFAVIEPTGVHHATTVSTTGQYIPPGTAGAWMNLNVVIGPTNVSFYKVQILEVGEDASGITGYFTNNPPLSHKVSNADVWHQVDSNNVIDLAAGFDTCTYWGNDSQHLPPPWAQGGFSWDIPARWRVGTAGVTNTMTGWHQDFMLQPDGTFMITKFGSNTVSRSVNNVIVPNL